MEITGYITALSALLALGLAIVVFFRESRSLTNGAFIVGLILLSLEAICITGALFSTASDAYIRWQRYRLIIAGFLPAPWLLFSLTYSRGNYREFLSRWQWVLYAFVLIPIAMTLVFQNAFFVYEDLPLYKTLPIKLGWAGNCINLALLLCDVMILMHLERTFSATVGTLRWRVKFMLLGVGFIFGFRLYTCSQTLLYNAINPSLIMLNALVLIPTCALMAVSLWRAKLSDVNIYPSLDILHGSITAILAGLYLLIVGLLAKLVVSLGGSTSFPVKAFVVLIALLGLSAILLSDRVRQRTRLFVSRHFRRAPYDYRQIWNAFTERTSASLDRSSYCRAVAKLISETLNSLSVTIWLLDDQRNELVYAASTLLGEEEGKMLADSRIKYGEQLLSLRKYPDPIDLDSDHQRYLADLERWNPDFFKKGGNRVCVPIVFGGELLGMIMLADRIDGVRFGVADMDLLRCIGDQVAAGLRNKLLSERVMRAKEMEAFQTMSTFFIHDLKNMAYTLSLMLQNMSNHFNDPDFREEAIRNLSSNIAHLNDIVGRFNLLRQGMQLNPTEADFNTVVKDVMGKLQGLAGVSVTIDLQPLPKILIDSEQIQRVITNLMLNAKDAVAKGGKIEVRTRPLNGWVILSITDNGVGMSSEFKDRYLFKPFSTTKKNGLGIGMFHCKTIVEAHHGKIEVETEIGKGTTFNVYFPSNTQKHEPETVNR